MTHDSEKLLADLKAQNRISPAQAEHFWPNLDLESQRAFAETAPVLAAAQHTDAIGGDA